ncbi:MFS transporter [Hoeflea sp. TYP-13]|uniref:MFS transporter n=1 Tax=Hoeflea sp. TYP-13 TaxID=3230023 RepID=UPI0034C6D45C
MSTAVLSRKSLIVLCIGFLVLFVGGGSRFAIGLVLKPMAEELDWTRGVFGGAAAIFLIVSSICMFASGRLADRYSLRVVLCGGLLISAIGTASMSFVEAPWQTLAFYGIVFAVGNGLASIAPVGVMVSRWFPGRIGFANAITVSGIGVGQLIIIGGLAVVLSDIGWRSAYVWLGAINLALVPIVAAGMARSSETGNSTSQVAARRIGMTLGQAMRTSRLWVLVVVYAICGFQDFFLATHVVAFAQDRGVETLMAGNLLAFMGLAGVAGVLLSGIWSDRKGPQRATFACFLLRTAVFALILFDQNTVSVALFALLFGTTFWVTAPLTVVFARDAFGIAHLGAISGMIVMVHHMCGGLGAYFGAVMFDLEGNYDTAFIIMLALSAIAAALCGLLQKTAHSQPDGQSNPVRQDELT